MTSLRHRPFALCRSWLFVPGADREKLEAAASSGADVLIQELEDFTLPDRRPEAGRLAPEIYRQWREAGAVVAVRINPLEDGGIADLEAVMQGGPDVVALPKVRSAEQVAALGEAIGAFEARFGLHGGSTALLPNIESAEGMMHLAAIAKASPRVIGCLIASEDLAADLGAERLADGSELDHARQRFLLETRAANVLAVDCPYTWSDPEGVRADTLKALRWGFKAKSAVAPGHAAILNEVLTPSDADVAQARRIVEAFESARANGEAGAELDGTLIEVPTFTMAQRLLARDAALKSTAH